MKIACRLSCYGPFQAAAAAHLAGLGIRAVELHVPAPADAEPVRRRLAAHGLCAVRVQVSLDLGSAQALESLHHQLDAALALGATELLLAPPAGLAATPRIDQVLRQVAAEAQERGARVLLETHPHLAGNAAEARDTLGRVAHPNLKINFDPANIGYYNEHGDALIELERLGSAIGGVHLKDGSGRFGERWFPALGDGAMAFDQMLALLRAVGFDGICAIEIEPPRDGSATRAAVEAAVEKSVAHLRRIGWPGV